MKNKLLVLVGHPSMIVEEVIRNQLKDNGRHKVSDRIDSKKGYYIRIVESSRPNEVEGRDYKDIIGQETRDSIIIWSHEYVDRSDHKYGSKKETFEVLKKSFNNLKWKFYSRGNSSSEFEKIITELSRNTPLPKWEDIISETEGRRFDPLRFGHRIMNLFLDLDIDYQGITTIKNQDKQQEYFDEVKCKKIDKRIKEIYDMLKDYDSIPGELEDKLDECKNSDLYRAIKNNSVEPIREKESPGFHKWFVELNDIFDKMNKK